MAELESPLPRAERRAHRRPLPLPVVKFVPAGNPSLPTFVSLMLMITTFMIVLTSISLHENTRMRSLMTSVRDAFAGGQGNAASGALVQGKLLGEAATGFKTALPLAVVETPAGGTRLILTLPLGTALDPTTGATTPEFDGAMAAMATALGKKPADLEASVELRFGDDGLGEAHAATLAAAALKGGLAPARLFIGSGIGTKEDLDILVRLDPLVAAPDGNTGAP